MHDFLFFPEKLLHQAAKLVQKYSNFKLMLGTAESCTGGLLGGLITSIPGSSAMYYEGIVSYSYQSKINRLNILQHTLSEYGAVSKEIAQQMVLGLLNNGLIDIAIGITGIAGPNGEVKGKEIGCVYLSCSNKKNSKCINKKCNFGPIGRNNVRLKSLEIALNMLEDIIYDN